MRTHEILNTRQIHQKIKRLAVEVLEHHIQSNLLVIIGIQGNGYLLAQRLCQELKQLSPEKTTELIKLCISKTSPQSELRLEPESQHIPFQSVPVLLVDDVMNSGKTMQYAIRHILNYQPEHLETLVLIQRSYALFPVNCNYVGIRLNTTLQEHVAVELNALDLNLDRVILQ